MNKSGESSHALGLPEAIEKLSVLEKSSDGFEIAEADLRLCGPGNILGAAPRNARVHSRRSPPIEVGTAH